MPTSPQKSRKFMTFSLAALIAGCLRSAGARPASKPTGHAASHAAATSADVIIIGAGMAGMAAATALKASGVTSVIVLEARGRVGGRIWTESVTAGGQTFSFELGAMWIHGVTGNPLVPVAKAAGVALQSKNTNYNNDALYTAAGNQVPDATQNGYDATWSAFEDYYANAQDNTDYTAGDPGLAPSINAFIARKGLSGSNLLAFKYALNVNVEHEYGAAAADLSLWFDDDKALPGGDKLVTGGYANLVKYMAQGVDVRLDTPVTEIDYSSSSAITIRTASAGTFTAKQVVVTLPLGVLKASAVTFTPALPAANAKAIASLGVGLLNKCILVFDRPFWGTSVEFLERISAQGNGAWEEWLSLYPAEGRPILYAFNAATYASSLETRTDAQVVAEAMAVLRTIWSGAPNPLQANVSRWQADPYARGSYSYTTTKQEFKPAHTNIGKSVGGGRVLFAGEHTRLDYPATVHGAYLSGRDAGCTIATSLNKKC